MNYRHVDFVFCSISLFTYQLRKNTKRESRSSLNHKQPTSSQIVCSFYLTFTLKSEEREIQIKINSDVNKQLCFESVSLFSSNECISSTFVMHTPCSIVDCRYTFLPATNGRLISDEHDTHDFFLLLFFSPDFFLTSNQRKSTARDSFFFKLPSSHVSHTQGKFVIFFPHLIPIGIKRTVIGIAR